MRDTDARGRRTIIVTLSATVAALIAATGAQAYLPGHLLWAKKIGSSTNEGGAYAVAGGPRGTSVVAGWRSIEPAGQPSMRVPMVARYGATGLKWVRTYKASPGYAKAVACDRSGNVCVAATIDPGGAGDLLLLKYDPAGALQWERRYDGPAHLDDLAEDVAVDRAGNVVVVGCSRAASQRAGIVVIKFGPSGSETWAAPARFDTDPADPNAGWVYPSALALDAASDVYIGGGSACQVSGAWVESALTLKFDGATGVKEWGQLYEAHHGDQSYAEQIAVKGTRVAIVGSTWGMTFGANENGLLVRYDAASGAQEYWKEWGAGNATGDWFGDVVLDGRGYAYVTGDQRRAGTGSFDRAVTMKFTPSLSKVVWKATYLPATRNAAGWHIARDGLGNIHVCGVKHDAKAHADFLIVVRPGGRAGVGQGVVRERARERRAQRPRAGDGRRCLRGWPGDGEGRHRPGGVAAVSALSNGCGSPDPRCDAATAESPSVPRLRRTAA